LHNSLQVAVVINKYIETGEIREMIEKIEFPILGIIPYSRCFIEADLKNIPPYKAECEIENFKRIKEEIKKIIEV